MTERAEDPSVGVYYFDVSQHPFAARQDNQIVPSSGLVPTKLQGRRLLCRPPTVCQFRSVRGCRANSATIQGRRYECCGILLCSPLYKGSGATRRGDIGGVVGMSSM